MERRVGNFFNWSLRAVVIVLLAVATAAAVNYFRAQPLAWHWQAPPPQAPTFDGIGELTAALARPQTVLVDARHPVFYEQGHIPGALSLHVGDADQLLPSFKQQLAPGAEIIIYCSDLHCPMADELAAKMMPLGLAPRVFSPGFDGWERAGEPVSTGSQTLEHGG